MRDEDSFRRQRLALVGEVTRVLERGEKVAIVGWRDSNHNSTTRRLSRSCLLEFVLQSPGHFGTSFGLVLCTKFISHSIFEALRKGNRVYPKVLSNGIIKKVLAECSEALLSAEEKIREAKSQPMDDLTLPVAVVPPQPTPQETPVPSKETEMLPAEEAKTEPDMERFVQRFLEQATITGGMVGKEVLGRIRRECGLDKVTNLDLVKMGYVISVKKDGCKNAGRYRAGIMMTGQATTEHKRPESNDPLSRARALVESEEAVKAEIKAIETRHEELRIELVKIERARELIAQLEDMFEEVK